MQLIGMLDSPYVRRVAISLQLMGLRFEHQSISVFRGFEQFRAINPVVKAPTLVFDDGQTLMDSTLILQYAESNSARRRSLMPADANEHRYALQVIGLALAACEKAVQILYERNLRPLDKQHAPWIERVSRQLQAAFAALEADWRERQSAHEPIDQAGLSTAVAWHFTQQVLPGMVAVDDHPALARHSLWAEALPEFVAAPHGDSTFRPAA